MSHRIIQSDTSFDDYDPQEAVEQQEQRADSMLTGFLMQRDADVLRTNPWGADGHAHILD